MSLTFQYDGSYLRKYTYTKRECLHILAILLYERDQIDTFGNRCMRFLIDFLRIFSKNLFAQKLEIPIPPREWIIQMIELLSAESGVEVSTTLRNSDAYKKIWQSVAGLSLERPFAGKIFDWFDFYSFMANN